MSNSTTATQASPEATLQKIFADLRRYDYGQQSTAPRELERLINATHGNAAARDRIGKELAALLLSGCSLAAKQVACEKLWIIGAGHALPAIERMLADGDPHVVEAACYALSRQPSPAAGRALVNALGKSSGAGRVAIIRLLGERREVAAAAPLMALVGQAAGAEAAEAITALGRLATPEAVRFLFETHAGNQARRQAAAHALLEAGCEVASRGEAGAARALLEKLAAATDIPHVRRGAALALQRMG